MSSQVKKDFVTEDLDVILHTYASGYSHASGYIIAHKFYVDTAKRVVVFEFTVDGSKPSDTVPASTTPS